MRQMKRREPEGRRPQRFTDYVWRNVGYNIVLSWLMIVVVSVLAYSGFLVVFKSRQLHTSLKIAADTVNRSLQAGDWSLALGHLQSLERSGHAFEITLKGSTAGANLSGPFGARPFGLGRLCATERVGAQADLSGCMRILGITEVYTLGYSLFFSVLVFLVALRFVQRKMLLFVNHVSEELKKIPALDPQEAVREAGEVEIEEVDAIRRHMLELLKTIEKASASEALTRLSVQVAHDIRSPLAALDSVATGVAQLPEEQRLIVRSAVGRIHDIANHLLEQHRTQLHGGVSQGGSVLEPAAERNVCLLSSLIAPVITEKRLEFRSHLGIGIDAQMDASSYGHFVAVQPTEFKRLLANLIQNAVEAIHTRGSVGVSLARGGDRILLTVEDTGKGIPAEVLGGLGQRGVTCGKAGGSGLGLYHAKTCVESWGGSLEISSEAGKGTTVLVKLPAAAPPAWFVSELELRLDYPVIILDDDPTIHQIWEGRFDSLAARAGAVETLHFSRAEEFRTWVQGNPTRAGSAVYLLDFELRGSPETGLTLTEELGLGDRAILVTSRFEETAILNECLRLNARMIPKGLAGFVPIACPLSRCPDAVLIDDDHLVHAVWKVAARTNGKTLDAFSTPREFLAKVGRLDKTTPIYVDSKLGEGVLGEDFAKELHAQGFRNLYLATGHHRDSLPVMPWIKEIVGKKAPWE